MYQILKKSKEGNGKYRVIFIAALLFSFHYYLIAYVNSTFLEESIDERLVGLLYSIGSLLNIYIFLKTPSLIKKYGNFRFIQIIAVLETLALLVLALIKNPAVIIVAFVIHHSINSIILSCLDMYLEDTSETRSMGKLRGTFLTIISVAAISSPLAIGSLVKNEDFSKIYLFSVFFMVLFLLWVVRRFKNIPSGQFREIKIIPEIKEFIKNQRVRSIAVCHSILQFFYSWMVIYVPLYLVKVAGFDWGEAAVIISISLLPFLLFEIPIGEMADKRLDEREIIICGFLLSGLALVFFPIIPNGQFILWVIVLFTARSGASLIETASESYFFRSIKGKDELIGIFRISSPFAFIVGPLVGSGLLLFLPFGSAFFILGFVMFLGALLALNIKKESIL